MGTDQGQPITLPVDDFRDRRVLVVGLGRFGGGVGVTRWLAARGALLTVTDQAGPETLGRSLAQIADLDVRLHLGRHDGLDPTEFDLAVINPAVVKRGSKLFGTLADAAVAWTTEINLFCERCPAKVVGVTGSYGKSTTCAMLAAVLEAAVGKNALTARAVHFGGNIGRSLLGDLDRIRSDDLVILELSNAQLEDLPRINWTPDVAAIVNLWPHHLDRYACVDEYFNAKLNIARGDGRGRSLIVGELHPRAEQLLGPVLTNASHRLVRITPAALELSVPGAHNQANAAAALAICRELGVDEAFARVTLRSFRGLPDRLEHVREVHGVTFLNDSKSTAPTATTMAVKAILETLRNESGHLIVIVGGQQKNMEWGECARLLAASCSGVVCCGECGTVLAGAIQSCGQRPAGPVHVPVIQADNNGTHTQARVFPVEDLTGAVALAHQLAQPGDVVLFSPGAPSFDAYVNYAARGEHFRELVKALERW